MSIIIAALIIIAGGVSAGAEGAAPGDALYPVKTGFNESIRGVFAMSAEGRAEWQSRLAIRRLEEAEELAAENRLDAETRADLQARFEEHAEEAEVKMNELRTEGEASAAAEASSNFESELRAHQNILAQLGSDTNTLSSNVASRLSAIVSLRMAAEAEMSSESSANTEGAANGAKKAARNKIDVAKKEFDNRSAELSAESKAEAEARINAAEAAYAEGEAKLAAQAYADAFQAYRRAHRSAQEAKQIMQADHRLELKINLGGNVNGNGNVNATSTNSNSNSNANVNSNSNMNTGGSLNVQIGY